MIVETRKYSRGNSLQNSAPNNRGRFGPRPFTYSEAEHESLKSAKDVDYSFCKLDYFRKALVHPKSKIGPINDKYEQETDGAAELVMRKIDTYPNWKIISEENDKFRAKPVSSQITNLQPEVKIEATQINQVKGQTFRVCPCVESAIISLRGSGQPLAKHERDFFESSFGHDFASIRVHADENAARVAAAINARAFTFGNDIAFSAGGYKPETTHGKRLLAHELTHIIQQTNINVPRKQVTGATTPNHTAEREANSVAKAVSCGGHAGSITTQIQAGVLAGDWKTEPLQTPFTLSDVELYRRSLSEARSRSAARSREELIREEIASQMTSLPSQRDPCWRYLPTDEESAVYVSVMNIVTQWEDAGGRNENDPCHNLINRGPIAETTIESVGEAAVETIVPGVEDIMGETRGRGLPGAIDTIFDIGDIVMAADMPSACANSESRERVREVSACIQFALRNGLNVRRTYQIFRAAREKLENRLSCQSEHAGASQ